MKSKIILFAFTVLFSLFLFLGIRASQVWFSDEEGPEGRIQDTTGPVLLQKHQEEPPPANPFTLIIFVDDLSKKEPILEGVWISRAGEEYSTVLLFPVFPSQAEDGEQRDLNLKGAFWLEEPSQPSIQFLTILSERNLSWSYILFLDHTAVRDIEFLLQELKPDIYQHDPNLMTGLIYSVENRAAVQENQAIFVRKFCQQLPLPGQNELMRKFLEGFGGHLQISFITPLEFYSSWQGVTQCVFPTLNLPVYQ